MTNPDHVSSLTDLIPNQERQIFERASADVGRCAVEQIVYAEHEVDLIDYLEAHLDVPIAPAELKGQMGTEFNPSYRPILFNKFVKKLQKDPRYADRLFVTGKTANRRYRLVPTDQPSLHGLQQTGSVKTTPTPTESVSPQKPNTGIANVKPHKPDPAYVFEDDSWFLRAACKGEDTELFYIPDGVRGPAKSRRIAAAKVFCSVCPVVDQCLKDSLKPGARDDYGVRGNLSADERKRLPDVT